MQTKKDCKSIEVLPEVPTPPHYKRKMALSTIGHVRKELSSLYREARTHGIDISDATKLGYLLQILAKVIEQSEFEGRVERLEREFRNEGFNKTYKGH